jgi:hypothetical protein
MAISTALAKKPSHFRRGDAVTVRSLTEILATLDADFKLDGLPFMPEMTPHCGKTYRVGRRADRTCVEGLGMRSLGNSVFLEGQRCDGSHHDGCQRGCLFFWNEAWLKPAEASGETAAHPNAVAAQLPTTKDGRFYCQSTELSSATRELCGGKLGHYLRDICNGELTVRRFLCFLFMAATNRIWRLVHGHTFYQLAGDQKKTENTELGLQSGELVEIRSRAEIQATLDDRGRNRGLSFEPEMALYCGRRFRVATPVRRIVAEESGKMLTLTNTVILEGVCCHGICSQNCPRANFLYWREIWLKRV